MKLYILIAILAGFQLMVISQTHTQDIRGQISDAQTLQPLPFANIIVLNSDPLIGTTSDINGNFHIKDIPIGRINLKITYIGYNPVELLNISHISGKTTIVNIFMEQMVISRQEVVITGRSSKHESVNSMATNSVRTFNTEETERYAGSRGDVARMASNFAGVVGNNDARNDIVVRGNSPTGLLWRLEGIEIPSPNHWAAFGSTGGPVSMLNNTLLTTSDFYSGAFPAEYGNATASVFDLRMRNGNRYNHEFLFQVGFAGFEGGAEGPILKSLNGSYLLNVRYSTMEVFEMLGMNFGTTGVPQYKDISFKINIPSTKVGSFSLFGLGGISKIEMWDSRIDTTDEDTDYYGFDNLDITNGSDLGILGMNHIFNISKNTYARTTIALTHHKNYTLIDSLIKPNNKKFTVYGNDFRESRMAASFSINSKLSSKHNIKSGVILTQRHLSLADSIFNNLYDRMICIRDMKGSAFLMQSYLQWHYKITNNLIMNGGIHYQNLFINNSFSVEPRLGLKYSFKRNQSVSLAFGRHSQILPIHIYYTETFIADENLYIPVNKNLEMTKSDHIVFGYDKSFNKHTRFKTELYYQSLFNVPVNANSFDSYSMLNEGANFGVWNPDSLKNSGLGRNMGIEFTFERFLHKGLYYLFTLSVFDSKYRASDKKWRNTAFNNNFITNALVGKEFLIPSKKGKSKSYLDLNLKFVFAGGQRYVPFSTAFDEQSEMYYQIMDYNNAFSKQYSPYMRVDFLIRFKRNTAKVTQEWGLEITNVLNNKNIFNISFDKKTGENKTVYQLPLMAIPQWRIRF